MNLRMGTSWTVRRLDSQPVQISEAVERVGIKFRVPHPGSRHRKRGAERRNEKTGADIPPQDGLDLSNPISARHGHD